MSNVKNCAVCGDGMSQTLIQNERFTDLTKLVKVQYPDMSVRLSRLEVERLPFMQCKAAGHATNFKASHPKNTRVPSDWDDEWYPIATSAEAQ